MRGLSSQAKAQGEITQPDRAWVGDGVYVATKSESGYLATLLDGYTRRVVGWAVSRYNDTALTLKALEQAISSRKPEVGLIHHGDHGSNYTRGEYRGRLAQIGAVVSHSRPGRPQENGIAESFNKTISYERIYLGEYENQAEVEADLADWMEPVYNGERLHSSLGYQSPADFEQNWTLHNQAVCGRV
jgi:putative transposase